MPVISLPSAPLHPESDGISGSQLFSHTAEVSSFARGSKNFTEERSTGPENSVKFLMPWMTFLSEYEQMQYDAFAASEVHALHFWLVCVPLFVDSILNILSISFRHNPTFDVIPRILRLALLLLFGIYIYSLKKGISITGKYQLSSVSIGNIVIIFQAISSGWLLISRVTNENCDPSHMFYYLACNQLGELNSLPLDSVIVNTFLLVVTPILCKTHRMWAVVVSFLIAASAGVIAIVRDQMYSASHVYVIVVLFLLILVIYEHDYNYIKAYVGLVNLESILRSKIASENEKEVMAMQSKELRHLIGNVAHDLKTPVQGFVMELDNLAVATSIRSKKESVRSLRATCAYMTMTINRAIDYTKANSGITLTPSMETVNVLSVLNWVKNCVGNSPMGVPVVIDELDEDMYPFVITDKQWLMENLLCLLSNAVKFSIEGTIAMKCKLVRSEAGNGVGNGGRDGMSWSKRLRTEIGDIVKTTPVSPSLNAIGGRKKYGTSESNSSYMNSFYKTSENDGARLRFEVEDSGVGIPENVMAALFKPFKQAQRRAGGTGLGLYSLSKRIESIGGEYGVCNRAEGKKGSCFWFTVPYRPDTTIDAESGMYEDLMLDINHFDVADERKMEEFSVSRSRHSVASSDNSSSISRSNQSEPKSLGSVREGSISPVDSGVNAVLALEKSSRRYPTVENSALEKAEAPLEQDEPMNSVLRSRLPPVVSKPVASPHVHYVEDYLKGARILVVDDSITIQKTTKRALTRAGVEVEVATNGAHCLKMLESEETYDIVLMDLQMPVLDGIETVTRIRSQEKESETEGERSHLFIIGVSANSDPETQQEALNAGMDAFVPKPLSVQLLIECCKKHKFSLERLKINESDSV